jgi:hypothetical protein
LKIKLETQNRKWRKRKEEIKNIKGEPPDRNPAATAHQQPAQTTKSARIPFGLDRKGHRLPPTGKQLGGAAEAVHHRCSIKIDAAALRRL